MNKLIALFAAAALVTACDDTSSSSSSSSGTSGSTATTAGTAGTSTSGSTGTSAGSSSTTTGGSSTGTTTGTGSTSGTSAGSAGGSTGSTSGSSGTSGSTGAMACAALLPEGPATPVVVHSSEQFGTNNVCEPGTSDGHGVILVSHHETSASLVTLYSPAGTVTGTASFWHAFEPGEQLSGFLGLNDAVSFSYVDALDATGHTTSLDSFGGYNGISAANPLGGVMVWLYGVGNEHPDDQGLWAYDAQGKRRWFAKSDEQGYPVALGVDREGNTLVLLGAQTASQQPYVKGIWFDKDGHAGAPFTAFAGSGFDFELAQQVGNGLFLRRIERDYSGSNGPTETSIWVAALPALATTPEAPPSWLAARPNTQMHMVHNGSGYAVLPLARNASTCSDAVEVLAADGTSCGTINFNLSAAACTTRSIRVGYDGTVIQQFPKSMEQCTPGGDCTCSYQWWPAYFH